MSYKLQGQALIMTSGRASPWPAWSNHHQHWLAVQRQCFRDSAAVAIQSRGHERQHFRTERAADNSALDPAVHFVVVALRYSAYGRYIYAVGGNRRSAQLIGISEFKYWVLAYIISGAFAALTGALLLGWSGGGFIGVGDQYLFTTLAAVVIGGTSLAGGYGGYGFTVIGVLVLQVLSPSRSASVSNTNGSSSSSGCSFCRWWPSTAARRISGRKSRNNLTFASSFQTTDVTGSVFRRRHEWTASPRRR